MQTLSRAAERNDLHGRLHEANNDMDGFDWYDGLARMTNVTAEITTAARSYRGQRGNRRRRPGRRMAVPRLSVQRKYVRRPASRASSGPRTARPCPSRALSSCGSAPWTKRLANADSIAIEPRDMALFKDLAAQMVLASAAAAIDGDAAAGAGSSA